MDEEINSEVDRAIALIKGKLQDALKIQCSNGNWNYDPYMHGMANGMIFCMSLFGDPSDNVPFLNAPAMWLKDYNKPVAKVALNDYENSKTAKTARGLDITQK